MEFFILPGSNYSWRSPPFIIQDIYFTPEYWKKLAYHECCKQAKNIGKSLRNLDIYSPLLHTKTNWTTCRDTSHLRAEHLLLFTPYSSTVYISQNPSYHEPWAHKFAIRRANIFLFRTQLFYNVGHMDMGLRPWGWGLHPAITHWWFWVVCGTYYRRHSSSIPRRPLFLVPRTLPTIQWQHNRWNIVILHYFCRIGWNKLL